MSSAQLSEYRGCGFLGWQLGSLSKREARSVDHTAAWLKHVANWLQNVHSKNNMVYFTFLLTLVFLLLCICVFMYSLPLFARFPLPQCPLTWQNKWEGPEEPMQYLRAVVTRALAIQVTLACVYIKRHPLLSFSVSVSVSLPFSHRHKTNAYNKQTQTYIHMK